MKLAISQRDRRVLIVGCTAIGLLVAGSRLVPAWLDWIRSARTEAMELSAEVAQVASSLRDARGVRDSLVSRRERLEEMSAVLIEGDSPAAAAGTLASLLADEAAIARMRLGSVQVRFDTAAPGAFVKVGVRADATGDVRGLTQLLGAIERGPVLLVVRELSISSPEPGGLVDRPEVLRVVLSVEGLARNPATRPGT